MNLSSEILRIEERAETKSTKVTASMLQNNLSIVLEILRKSNSKRVT